MSGIAARRARWRASLARSASSARSRPVMSRPLPTMAARVPLHLVQERCLSATTRLAMYPRFAARVG